MQTTSFRCLALALFIAAALNATAAEPDAQSKDSQSKDSQSKDTQSKSEPEKLEVETSNPWNRPEGSITDQTARIFIWYDDDGWHLRTTSKTGHEFTGSIRVKNAVIKSCISVGLKTDKQGANPDVWQVNDARDELRFKFHTGKASDGFDMTVKGDDGQLQFDLKIDNVSKPRSILIGRDRKRPSKSPFAFPTKPAKPPKSKPPDSQLQ